MRKFLLSVLLASGLVSTALAQEDRETTQTPQSLTGDLVRAASVYANAGDYETSKRMLEATLAVKPGQIAYLRYLVIIAMQADRPGDAFAALDRIVEAGLYMDLTPYAEGLRQADAERFRALHSALATNNAPEGSAERYVVIDEPDALIEGVAMDIETDRLFVSSVAGRQILMFEPFSPDEPVVFADADDGLWSVFGIAVDDRTRMVWAASGVVPQTPLGEGEEVGTALFAFDAVSGDLYRRFEIEGAQRIADFVVRDGSVYVTDSGAPRIYVLDSISGRLRVLVEDERFSNLQGVALTRGALYVADYSIGIWRIDLGDRSVSLVSPGEESLIGIDGLLQTRDGRLIAVRNGVTPHQVMAIDLDREGRRVDNVDVLLRNHPDMIDHTEPTLIDLADGRAWLVANGAWPLFPEDGSVPEQARPPTYILELLVPQEQ